MNNSSHQSHRPHLKIANPCRTQVEMNFFCLDDRISHDHKARAVWDFVQELDTSILYEMVESTKGAPGRMATSPQVFLALWLYAITEGTVSARRIERECQENDAYRWIAGGVGVNRNNLSNFRNKHFTTFHVLLTESLAVMVKNGVLQEEDFSQDGTRIKAAAGFNTFRSETSIEEVKTAICTLIKEIEKEEKKTTSREKGVNLKRQKKYATRRLERAQQAVQELEKHKASLINNGQKNRESPKVLEKRLDKVRASLVDPEVRKMKMGDGGFRLAFNLQFATGVDSRAIYGVDVVNTLDPGTMPPMIAQVAYRLNQLGISMPSHWIGDAAYSGKDDLNTVYELYPDINVIAAPQQKLEIAQQEKKMDSEAVKRWRKSIGTDEFKKTYKQRCSTAEFSNMQTKIQGVGQILVRGLQKVKSMCLLHAIAFNMGRFWDLS
jgi:transposase